MGSVVDRDNGKLTVHTPGSKAQKASTIIESCELQGLMQR